MKQFTGQLENIITGLLLLVAGVTPLLFLNQTTEFYEMPKLVFLVVATTILYGLWIFSWIMKGKVVITRTPLDFPLFLLLLVVIGSTFFSATRYPAIYGNFPRVHGSAIAWVTYILLYYVTVSHLKTMASVRAFLYVLYGSAVVVALISLLSYFNIFLPFDFARGVNFTPTGSSFSTVAFLLLLLPLPLLSLVTPNKYLPVPVALTLSLLFGVVIALIGSLASYIALAVLFGLAIMAPRPNRARKNLALLAIPGIVTVLMLVLSYVQFPGNGLQQLQANFPKEIQLPLATSWKVSASSFRDAPIIGTGPSTYLFNFTTYKPLEFNQLQFWNISFDTANNEFLQVLGTLGLLGFIALVLFCAVVLQTSRKSLVYDTADTTHDNSQVLLFSLAVSGVVSIILLLIHATTLMSTVATLFILAALMASQKSVRDRVTELSLGLKASTADNRQFDLLPVIIFIIFLIGAVPLLYRTFNVVYADTFHRKALAQANTNGRLTYEYLQRAETLNPYIDLYRVDMAQTNFALANAIASNAIQNSQNQASPAAALTDQDRQTIQALLSQAVNEARAATALSPRSARNWEVMASIYRNITGVAQNALAFSLDAYGRAIQRDPLNPALRVNVGGLYYSVRNHDLAIRFFSDAANLKPDYANAYFNLSIALREKGDLTNARSVAEQTVRLLQDDKENPSYKVAVDLLDDLKAKIATGSASTTGQQAPAAQTGSALENPNLPDVEVGTGTTPPATTPAPTVQPNPNANLPQVTAAPANPTAAPAN